MSADWTIASCAQRDVRSLAAALGISEVTAAVLVRRGLAEPEAARAFLAGAEPEYDVLQLGDMAGAVEAVRTAVAAGKRICVHGDYDVDGICATTLAVLLLRELGAEVEWHLPSRFDEGYGVSRATIARLAEEGCGLVLTVDCGITAVEEVAEARARGLDVVVTDHHRPGAVLPDCPVVATLVGDYPFTGLCGTGVVLKLAQALLGREHPFCARHLDLVALATIADVVPLVDENRALAISGLRALARTQKQGLQALMRVAGVDPAAVDAGAVGFRLAPRINAAGRLGHPRAALDLLLTEDRDQAHLLASELERLNRDRQLVEERIRREAIKQIESWPEPLKRRRGYVVAGADWHEGVIGIVASRLVEKYNRPIVLIAGTDEAWKGSGRSIPSFDLHGALGACSEHLERFGGHRAAAGLSILPESLEAFAAAFAEQAEAALAEEDLRATVQVDAILPPGTPLTLDLCAELERLAPFGLGNPGVVLLAAGCEIAEASTVGEGKHLRFRVRENGRDAGSAIAFGLGGQLDRFRRELRYDVAFRPQENRWNGTSSPQLVVKRIFEADERYEELRAWLVAQFKLEEADRDVDAAAVFAELDLEEGGRRHLLESQAFRALLAREPALAEAA